MLLHYEDLSRDLTEKLSSKWVNKSFNIPLLRLIEYEALSSWNIKM